MRYADGGGLTARGRAARERVRLQATELFEQRLPAGEIARRLRVSPKSVRAWPCCPPRTSSCTPRSS
jgi:hypothetical protein